MIPLSIIIGIIAIIAAHQAGLTATWLGTGSVTSLVLFMCILALPQCHWLFDSMAGFAIVVALWVAYTTLVYRLLSDKRRCAPMHADARRFVMWRMGRRVFVMGVASC